jgi:hypothetical protein
VHTHTHIYLMMQLSIRESISNYWYCPHPFFDWQKFDFCKFSPSVTLPNQKFKVQILMLTVMHSFVMLTLWTPSTTYFVRSICVLQVYKPSEMQSCKKKKSTKLMSSKFVHVLLILFFFIYSHVHTLFGSFLHPAPLP